MTEENLQAALKKFEELVREQSARSDRIKAEKDFIDYDKLDKIIIGVAPDPYDPEKDSEEEIRAKARDFVARFCSDPSKVCIINRYFSPYLNGAYAEELYKASRLVYENN